MKRNTFKFLLAVSAILLTGLFAPIPLYSDDIFGDIVKNAANQATNKAIEAVPTLLAGGGKAKSGHPKASGSDTEQANQSQAKSHTKKHATPTPTDEEGASPVTAIPATQADTSSAVSEGNDLKGTQGSFPVSALKSVAPFQRFQPATPEPASQAITPAQGSVPVPVATSSPRIPSLPPGPSSTRAWRLWTKATWKAPRPVGGSSRRAVGCPT